MTWDSKNLLTNIQDHNVSVELVPAPPHRPVGIKEFLGKDEQLDKRSILEIALDPSVVALARDKETVRLDSRAQDGPKPDDFGYFPPIPLDAVAAVVTIATEEIDSLDVDEDGTR